MSNGQDIDRRAALQMLAALGGVTVVATADGESGSDLHGEIDAVLRRTAEIWNSQHFSELKEVWDGDDPEPWYVPEEVPKALHSWPEIERYWKPGRRVLKAFRWEFSNLRVKPLAPDLALALFDHFYEIELAIGPPAPPTAGFDRCLALFRRKPEGWRHILYAQCPLGPDTYVRTMRQKLVRPDFAEFSRQVEAKYGEGHASPPVSSPGSAP
jgi:hypothetical protein